MALGEPGENDPRFTAARVCRRCGCRGRRCSLDALSALPDFQVSNPRSTGDAKDTLKANLLAIEFLPHHLKNVSGVTVAQFLSLIEPHFRRLTIPTKNKTVETKDFHSCLSEMYDHDQRDEAILFQKHV